MDIDSLLDSSDSLERQNEKLQRIVASLMDRVERNTEQTGNAYSLFQRAIALEGEVKARTRDLQRTLDALNRANEELAAASTAADEANRAKSRFVAAASHDVRQPLTAARLFLESLGRTDLNTEQDQIVGQMASAFQSIETILGSLLDISRLDSSATRADITAIPLAQVLDPVVAELQPTARQNGVDLRVIRSSAWVDSDPYYLRQIVQNLVVNALQYSDGGRVLIGCRSDGDACRLEIHDTGPGIAEADIPVIFEEFKRLNGPRAAQGGDGVGLGLAIVERACRLLGHSLGITSFPGQGTTFTVRLPRASEPRAPALDGQPDGGGEADAQIVLVLSPDPALIGRISGLIDPWGMVGVGAADAVEAQQTIDQLGMAPDAIVFDSACAQAAAACQSLLRAIPIGKVIAIGADAIPAAEAIPALSDAIRVDKSIPPHRLRAALLR